MCSPIISGVGTWEAEDPAYSRPIAAPPERCAELLGVDLATIRRVAADVEPYLRLDGTQVWSLMQLERRLWPEAYGRVRGGYLSRRRRPAREHRSPGWAESARPSTALGWLQGSQGGDA
jgi:hypothetical protein